jgi:hypothetical protein
MNDSAPDTLFPPPPSTRFCGQLPDSEHIGCNHFAQVDAEREAAYWRRVLRVSVTVTKVEVKNDAR